MESFYSVFLLIFAGVNLGLSVKAYYECKHKKNAFGLTMPLYPLGMYVWGDALIFGMFWALAAIASVILQDFLLFLLIVSVFYLVRSIGETIYWFNQQFSTIIRMRPEDYPTHKIFHNDSVWFIFQIANQCVTVVTIITTVYLFSLWLK